ncbi:MAG: hypothetical protein ACLUOI_26160 [Eisenbergiella sp.]
MENKLGKGWNFIKRHKKMGIAVLIVAVGVVIVQVVSAMGAKQPCRRPCSRQRLWSGGSDEHAERTGTVESQEQGDQFDAPEL